MNTENSRLSTNVEYDCLGSRAGSGDANYGAMQKCLAEVTGLQTVGTASRDANDMGVSAVREAIVYNLQQGNIAAVEKFLNKPTTTNIPAGGDRGADKIFGWSVPDQVSGTTNSGPHLNPDLAAPIEKISQSARDLYSHLRGYDTSTKHKVELITQTAKLLKSPAGDDLVIQYDRENGPT